MRDASAVGGYGGALSGTPFFSRKVWILRVKTSAPFTRSGWRRRTTVTSPSLPPLGRRFASRFGGRRGSSPGMAIVRPGGGLRKRCDDDSLWWCCGFASRGWQSWAVSAAELSARSTRPRGGGICRGGSLGRGVAAVSGRRLRKFCNIEDVWSFILVLIFVFVTSMWLGNHCSLKNSSHKMIYYETVANFS